jgi:hypothetical protein
VLSWEGELDTQITALSEQLDHVFGEVAFNGYEAERADFDVDALARELLELEGEGI